MNIGIALVIVCAVGGIATPVRADESMESVNVAGYVSTTIKHGENVIGLPKKASGEHHTLVDIVPMLEDGDKVQYDDGFEIRWAEVIDDADGIRHAFDEDLNSYVDDRKLPSIGDRQILMVRRLSKEETQIPLSGTFDMEMPLRPSDFVVEPAPLDKIKIDRSIIDSLTASVTITNKVQVPFATVVSKKFDIVLKDGSRLRVMVDPRTQIIVDAQSEKPISISTSDIARFEEIGKGGDVPSGEKASKLELPKVAAEVAAKSKNYNIAQSVREAVIGTLWDAEDVSGSLIRWGIVTLVLGLIAKIGDLLWGCLLGKVKWLFVLAWNKKWLLIYWLRRIFR